MIAPRKICSDAKLAHLPPAAQALLLQKLEQVSYQEAALWVQKEYGIQVNASYLSKFPAGQKAASITSQAREQVQVPEQLFEWMKEMIAAGPDRRLPNDAIRMLFEQLVVATADLKTYLEIRRLHQTERLLDLRKAAQERKMAQARS